MEVNEAIEWIKNEINYNYNGQNEELRNRLYLFNCGMEDIISLLQQGEAYKQIAEELCDLIISKAMNDNADNDILELEQRRYELDKKYFPKEAKKDEAKDHRE